MKPGVGPIVTYFAKRTFAPIGYIGKQHVYQENEPYTSARIVCSHYKSPSPNCFISQGGDYLTHVFLNELRARL
ncbi:hypothetical protein SprV_0200796500 [Sparganum proliferum]